MGGWPFRFFFFFFQRSLLDLDLLLAFVGHRPGPDQARTRGLGWLEGLLTCSRAHPEICRPGGKISAKGLQHSFLE